MRNISKQKGCEWVRQIGVNKRGGNKRRSSDQENKKKNNNNTPDTSEADVGCEMIPFQKENKNPET